MEFYAYHGDKGHSTTTMRWDGSSLRFSLGVSKINDLIRGFHRKGGNDEEHLSHVWDSYSLSSLRPVIRVEFSCSFRRSTSSKHRIHQQDYGNDVERFGLETWFIPDGEGRACASVPAEVR